MTLRQRIAAHVEFVASLNDAAEFMKRTPRWRDKEFRMTYVVGSKAEADEIIESWGNAARPVWRNGRYGAELKPAPDGVIFHIEFALPISEQAA